jgi:hypothetical protein
MIRAIFSLTFLFMITACYHRTPYVSRSELVQYSLNPENGLIHSTNREGLEIQALYRPKELIMDQLRDTEKQQEWDSLTVALSDYSYFIIKLSRANKEIETHFAAVPEAHRELQVYLNGAIGNDFVLISGRDTVSVDQVLYTPYFGTSGQTSLMLIFRSGSVTRHRDFALVYNDSFLGSGLSLFKFERKKINRIPHLNWQSHL